MTVAPVLSANLSSSEVIIGSKLILTTDIEGVNIYYTLDGSDPSVESAVYSAPITISEALTIKAVALSEDYLESNRLEIALTVREASEEEIGDVAIDDVPGGVIENILEGLWIAGVEEDGYIYTGKAISPSVRIYNGKTLLTAGKDYTIKYSNNKAVASKDKPKNAPTITVTGKGNYSGSTVCKFSILQKNIETGVAVNNLLVGYNKKVQKLVPTVTYNGIKLKKGTDFTVEYPNTGLDDYKVSGTYDIVIRGKGNFTGELHVTETITNSVLMTKASVEGVKTLAYTGDELTQAGMIVKYNKKVLVAGEDYSVSYQNNVEIGTATITITGLGSQTERGSFLGEKKVTFKITGTALSKAKMYGFASSKVYTGEEIEQTAELRFGDITLVEDEDYEVTYSKNVNVGTATVVYKGINAYSGSIKKTFKIVGYDIKTDVDNLINVTYDSEISYSKGGAKPVPVVSFGSEYLTAGTDYTVSYKNNTAVNDGTNSKKLPTMTIAGKGKFKGKLVFTDWTIVAKDLSDLENAVIVPDKGYSAAKNGWMSGVTVKDNDGKVLKVGTDYEKSVSYTYLNPTVLEDSEVRGAGANVEPYDKVPVGTEIQVEVTAKGNYTGSISDVYVITEKSLASVSVTVKSKYYTGKEIELSDEDITVMVGKTDTLVLGEDYEIVGYTNNLKKGTAYVTIKGIGNYGGTKTVKFTIKAKLFRWFE